MRVLASAVLLALVDRFGGGAYWQIGPSSWRESPQPGLC